MNFDILDLPIFKTIFDLRICIWGSSVIGRHVTVTRSTQSLTSYVAEKCVLDVAESWSLCIEYFSSENSTFTIEVSCTFIVSGIGGLTPNTEHFILPWSGML